jgi:hypothetical protein
MNLNTFWDRVRIAYFMFIVHIHTYVHILDYNRLSGHCKLVGEREKNSCFLNVSLCSKCVLLYNLDTGLKLLFLILFIKAINIYIYILIYRNEDEEYELNTKQMPPNEFLNTHDLCVYAYDWVLDEVNITLNFLITIKLLLIRTLVSFLFFHKIHSRMSSSHFNFYDLVENIKYWQKKNVLWRFNKLNVSCYAFKWQNWKN